MIFGFGFDIWPLVTFIMTNNKADKVIEELFQSLLSRYHSGLAKAMKCNDFIFDSFHLLH